MPICVLRLAQASMLVLLLGATITGASAAGDPKRGEYLAKASGCLACHTADRKDATPYAGGRALKTPFGTFYGPNITAHPEAGIGRWTQADFIQAMRMGRRPDGAHYYPAFPYTAFTQIKDGDLHDLWAYLRTLPPSAQPNREHDLPFPFNWRWPLAIWKWLFFTPGVHTDDSRHSSDINRGAYLVKALSHCGECHTPRNFMGGPISSRFLGGGKGPDGKNVPNLTPSRLKKWSDSELRDFLVAGILPDGDVPSETMGEVIHNTTSQLTPEDLQAMIAYLRALPPLPEEPR